MFLRDTRRHGAPATERTDMATFLTQAETAELLRISGRKLERHRLDGTGPRFARIGRRVVYAQSEIDAWIEANTFRSTAEADRAS